MRQRTRVQVESAASHRRYATATLEASEAELDPEMSAIARSVLVSSSKQHAAPSSSASEIALAAVLRAPASSSLHANKS